MNHPTPPLLSGKKVTLRAYTQEDLDLAVAYLNDFTVRELMWPDIMFPFRKEDELKWYESFSAISEGVYHFSLARNDTGDYSGGCGIAEANQRSRVITIVIYVGKPHQNIGFGSEAMRLLVDFCFMEMNMNKVKLKVYEFNKRAIHCYEKIGFQVEGKLRQELYRNGRYWDEWIMSMLRSEWESQNGCRHDLV